MKKVKIIIEMITAKVAAKVKKKTLKTHAQLWLVNSSNRTRTSTHIHTYVYSATYEYV